MTEDYVSFEIAKLLKEKGFDMPTERFYNEDGTYCCGASAYNWNDDDEDCSCPTLQMAMKWLREVHNKHCDIGYDIDLKWFFQIIDLKETVDYDYLETKYYHPENGTGFKSYEEAGEAAILYCLKNLI